MKDEVSRAIAEKAHQYTDDMVQFLRDMIAIPSESGDEERVVRRAAEEMERVGFDEVKIDAFGNVLGRVGSGKTIVALDAHLDTVGVGDRSTFRFDPYAGVIENGVIFGRGASDQEGGMAAAVHGARIAKELGLLENVSLWVTGTIMEEDCDGLCWQYILREGVLRPDVVISTEATNLAVYRGHRGRMEIELRTQGRSAHGSAPERGVNAIYKMAPIIEDIARHNEDLAATADPFLGKGSVTISAIRSTSPSLCAVADSCTIHLDRRLTKGETEQNALEAIARLSAVNREGASLSVLDYARPTWRGLVYPTRKYYPTWVLEENHPAIQAALRAGEHALGHAPKVGKWTFSTNGIATAGMFGIPTLGFGPGDEVHAHTPEDQCPIEHLTIAAKFYAAFSAAFVGKSF
ncbi:MAG TPA: YgeY family selenium metabolism-linked hydrolase [Polyangium sp.]|nr:YgeY family selenium metabolism-linked hydrolase [Polyangium sp.]